VHGTPQPTVVPPRVLKVDALGRVEWWPGEPPQVQRVACGGRLPGSAWVARRLLAREQRALRALAGLPGVPQEPQRLAADRLARTYLEGTPLHRASALPEDFFEQLEVLVQAVHRRGVCHNDLHKEQNVLVLSDGRPGLIDFQLASVHRRASALRRSRCGDDLRHVAKHRLRYLRRGAPKAPEERSARALPRRSLLAGLWRRTGKPIYHWVTRALLGRRDGEERRPSSGPWPRWTEPLARPRAPDPPRHRPGDPAARSGGSPPPPEG
jgi:hypothetical protein